ncbi:MAG: thioredoxin domain-containing protein [Motiliproteus sp.]
MTQDASQAKPKSPFTVINVVTAVILVAGAIFFLKPQSEQNRTENPTPLFTLSGQQYSYEDLPLRFSQPLYQAELNTFRLKERIVGAAVVQRYLEQQMEKSGEDQETVVKRLFNPTPPTEQQIQQFFEQNKAKINVPLDQARNDIARLIAAAEQQKKEMELLAKLVSLEELEFNLNEPKAPFATIDTAGYPSKGPAQSGVTLIEFADYQCPHCQTAHSVLKEILPEYLDRVRYVYMDFPINRSGISRKVSTGAACADQQQQFWAYHDLAFERQSDLSAESPLQLAEELKLDMEQFNRCYSADATATKIKQSEQQAIKAGVTGTPSFFLNGKKLRLRDLRTGLPEQLQQALQIPPQN